MDSTAPAPLRPCSHPGCPTLVRYGRCSTHRTPLSSLPAPIRSHFTHTHKAFYNSRAWKQARSSYLLLNPICETCGRSPSTEVHHKLPLSAHPELALDPTNYRAQCKPCHSKETVQQDGGFGQAPRKERK